MNMTVAIRETLMYQNLFSSRVFLIKISGKVLNHSCFFEIIRDIALLQKSGVQVILVHGCGYQIDAQLVKIDEEIKKDNGVRITSFRAMKVIVKIAQEYRNKIIVQLKKQNCAVYGDCEQAIIAHKTSPHNYTGEIVRIKKRAIKKILSRGIAVIAPLGVSKSGDFLNINADHVAFSLAVAFKAAKLIFMTDVSGIYGERGFIAELTSREAEDLIRRDIITCGMIPKTLSCINALSKGVSSITILSGLKEGALLKEVFTKKGCGTMITR